VPPTLRADVSARNQMSLAADFHAGIPDRYKHSLAAKVLRLRDGFHVVWVDAVPPLAQVINVEVIRDRPNVVDVEEAVSVLPVEPCVTILIDVACPEPASGDGVELVSLVRGDASHA